jgi:hypothetical protein
MKRLKVWNINNACNNTSINNGQKVLEKMNNYWSTGTPTTAALLRELIGTCVCVETYEQLSCKKQSGTNDAARSVETEMSVADCHIISEYIWQKIIYIYRPRIKLIL